MQAAIDKGQIQINQAIEHVVAFVLGADIQGWRDDNSLHHISRHRLITLTLAAADGPDRDRVLRHAEFFYHGAREPVAQVPRTRDSYRFSLEVFGSLDFFSRH